MRRCLSSVSAEDQKVWQCSFAFQFNNFIIVIVIVVVVDYIWTMYAGEMPMCPHLLQLLITYTYYLLRITLRIGLQFQCR